MAALFGDLKSKEERRKERERKQEILIAKFEQNPLLYDRQNEFYKDSKKKAGVVKEIGEILSWTPNELLVAWRNLRDRYKKERNVIEMDKSGAGARKRKLEIF